MVKIKKDKTFNFIEFIQYVWDNNISDTTYTSYDKYLDKLGFVSIGNNGNITSIFRNDGVSDKDFVFNVDVEEDIDENTIIPKVIEVYKNFDYAEFETETITNISISEAIGRATYSIYMVTEEGILTLLWSKDGGMQ